MTAISGILSLGPANAQSTFQRVGEVVVVGGNGGEYKPEAPTTYNAGPISAIRICAGRLVDSVQVKYGDQWGTKYGGNGGRCETVTIPANKGIECIWVAHGNVIDGIGFIVDGTYYLFGGFGGKQTWIESPRAEATLGYIEAQSGNVVDQMRFNFGTRSGYQPEKSGARCTMGRGGGA
ncbi:hypothetical protein [Sphingomicrobium sediminis]|uniref:Jacalin-type lectin domain-containing protein n=1 Tax=Sphingomicrobium sediminis TaxID=2950949 RepID=A0A9X2EJC9_9SPHN|nr:hypothetical protein [Sphingomicrobium sediminis]MCM8556669.1 hypothetical protein [Sphingomicrobium sediminis]